MDCGNYRPITVSDAAYRILMKMLTSRITKILIEGKVIADEQGGFRKGRAPTDNVLLLKEIIRGAKKDKKKLYLLFVDIKKCYDRTSHSLIERTLEAMGFPKATRAFLTKIYRENSAEILLGEGRKGKPFDIGIGVKQGCPLYPTILNLVLDPIIRSMTSSPPRLLGYVDDICLASTDCQTFKEDTQKLTRLLAQAGFELGMDMSTKSKTVVMTDERNLEELRVSAQLFKGAARWSTTYRS